jgi:uncharacterized membrane protein YebE (DUF533 family)
MDAKRLLDQFLGAGGSGSFGGSRGGTQGGSGGLLGEIQRGVGGLMGGQGGQSGQGLGGLLGGGAGGDVLGNLQRHAGANPLASGALAGGLAAVLLGNKGGRGLSRDVVKLGGLGLIAGMAYKAYQEHQAKQAGQTPPSQAQPSSAGQAQIQPPPRDSGFLPSDNEAEDRARLLVTAMIAAAKADGYIDQGEQERIFERVGALELDAEAKGYLMDQLRAPLDLDGIVRAAGKPEVATEVYAASLLAIDPDHPAEKAYLQMLAARLGLADDLVLEIHRAAEAARA